MVSVLAGRDTVGQAAHRASDRHVDGAVQRCGERLGTGHDVRLPAVSAAETVRACAQTRTFTTSRDAVQALGASEAVHTPGVVRQLRGIDVDVTEGRPGGHVAATFSQTNVGGPFELPLGSPTGTQITCLAVSGRIAVVGFRNDITLPPDAAFLQYGLMTLFDGGPAGACRDSVSARWTGGDPDPKACSDPNRPERPAAAAAR